jgi:hypothetical protein
MFGIKARRPLNAMREKITDTARFPRRSLK